MSVWERFNNIEGASANEVAEARSQLEPIEAGTYKVRVEGLEASESKSGLPMVKGRFRILEGKRENSLIFYNQVLQNLNYPNITALNISKVMTLLSGLLGERVDFEGMVELEELIKSIPEGIEVEMEVKYEERDTNNSFPQLTVVEKQETEPLFYGIGIQSPDDDEDEEDEDLPF